MLTDREGISRQGVHDLLHRCDKSLQEYEEKLGLIERFGRNRKRLEKLKEDLSDPKDRKVIDEILEEL